MSEVGVEGQASEEVPVGAPVVTSEEQVRPGLVTAGAERGVERNVEPSARERVPVVPGWEPV